MISELPIIQSLMEINRKIRSCKIILEINNYPHHVKLGCNSMVYIIRTVLYSLPRYIIGEFFLLIYGNILYILIMMFGYEIIEIKNTEEFSYEN